MADRSKRFDEFRARVVSGESCRDCDRKGLCSAFVFNRGDISGVKVIVVSEQVSGKQRKDWVKNGAGESLLAFVEKALEKEANSGSGEVPKFICELAGAQEISLLSGEFYLSSAIKCIPDGDAKISLKNLQSCYNILKGELDIIITGSETKDMVIISVGNQSVAAVNKYLGIIETIANKDRHGIVRMITAKNDNRNGNRVEMVLHGKKITNLRVVHPSHEDQLFSNDEKKGGGEAGFLRARKAECATWLQDRRRRH